MSQIETLYDTIIAGTYTYAGFDGRSYRVVSSIYTAHGNDEFREALKRSVGVKYRLDKLISDDDVNIAIKIIMRFIHTSNIASSDMPALANAIVIANIFEVKKFITAAVQIWCNYISTLVKVEVNNTITSAEHLGGLLTSVLKNDFSTNSITIIASKTMAAVNKFSFTTSGELMVIDAAGYRITDSISSIEPKDAAARESLNKLFAKVPAATKKSFNDIISEMFKGANASAIKIITAGF